VRSRFHAEHSLGAFDFFSIIIWKANRAKSKIARRLLKEERKGKRDLETRCRALTKSLYNASDQKERLRLLIKDWGFALPMASAILAICWPEEFTVYDYRVRDQIKGFPKLNTANSKFDFFSRNVLQRPLQNYGAVWRMLVQRGHHCKSSRCN